jgi:maltose O-acetyltransferase
MLMKKFKEANLDHVALGPELDKRFEIRHPERLTIGFRTAINGDCFINAWGGVIIGKYCHIGKGLTIYSHNHNWKSEEYIPYDSKDIIKPVKIGDCVWIGANVTIAPGTEIENGVIISNGAVVFGKIPKCAIIRGNPAQIIGYRDIETYNKLESQERFM